MLPPTSQPVWVLPMLTVAANGTTETQRCGCVSAPPYSMFSNWFDAAISDVIDDPASEPVLSSTSDSSSPKAALCPVDAAFTVTGPMPMIPSSVGVTMAELVNCTLPATPPGAGLWTTGSVAALPM